jgi:hypothetical protein
MANVYCLKKKKSTKELHLFECVPSGATCACEPKSVCDKMFKAESEGDNLFTCESEATTRKKCAEIGRNICGTCVSRLYTTY